MLKRHLEKYGGLAVKIILSAIALWGFGLILYFMQFWLAGTAPPPANAAPPPGELSEKNLPSADTATFWPRFPGAFDRNVHKMIINGVDTISEDWQTLMPATDIIAYYREQMVARGWRDVTEEAMQLQPENHAGHNELQDPSFVEKYGSLMDSSLILSRKPWSLQVVAVPSDKRAGQTSVRVFAGTTPSIKEFYLSIGEGTFKTGAMGPVGGAIDTVQESGGQKTHTVVAIEKGEAARVFNQRLKEYDGKKWHAVIFSQGQNGRPYCAWLVKDQAFAVLSVKALPQGKGSSVMLTEVTPSAPSTSTR